MTIINPFGLHHYQATLQPNPIFPLQIQFSSITQIHQWLFMFPTSFFTKKKETDRLWPNAGQPKLQFPFVMLVLQGTQEKKTKPLQSKKMQMNTQLSAEEYPGDMTKYYISNHA